MENILLDRKTVSAVEKRAGKARLTMGDICRLANVSHSTWSRAKKRGNIRAKTLAAIEEAISEALVSPKINADYIYALADLDGTVRYVGRTTKADLSQRLATHRTAQTDLGDWVRSVSAQMILLETVNWAVGVAPGKRERFWIEHYREAGADLFNVWPMEEKNDG